MSKLNFDPNKLFTVLLLHFTFATGRWKLVGNITDRKSIIIKIQTQKVPSSKKF